MRRRTPRAARRNPEAAWPATPRERLDLLKVVQHVDGVARDTPGGGLETVGCVIERLLAIAGLAGYPELMPVLRRFARGRDVADATWARLERRLSAAGWPAPAFVGDAVMYGRDLPAAAVRLLLEEARTGASFDDGLYAAAAALVAADAATPADVGAQVASCLLATPPDERLALRVERAAARTLFLDAWATREEERGRGARFAGREIDDVAPAKTPRAAYVATKRLRAAFERANGARLDRLYLAAAALRPGEHDRAPSPELFGHYLAMEALGHGVAWSDDHPDHGYVVPSVEFYL